MTNQKAPICMIGDKLAVRRVIAKELSKQYFAVAGSFDEWNVFSAPDGLILEPEAILVLALDANDRPEGQIIELRRAFPEAHVVVLGDTASRERVDACIDAGASGYLSWPISAAKLVHLTRLILAGEKIVMAKRTNPADTAKTLAPTEVARPETADAGTVADVPPSERRQSFRQKVLKKGRIALDDGRGEIDCTVLDLSETGAKLRANRANRIPRCFTLKLDGVIGSQGNRCEIVRRSDATFAVRFTETTAVYPSILKDEFLDHGEAPRFTRMEQIKQAS